MCLQQSFQHKNHANKHEHTGNLHHIRNPALEGRLEKNKLTYRSKSHYSVTATRYFHAVASSINPGPHLISSRTHKVIACFHFHLLCKYNSVHVYTCAPSGKKIRFPKLPPAILSESPCRGHEKKMLRFLPKRKCKSIQWEMLLLMTIPD